MITIKPGCPNIDNLALLEGYLAHASNQQIRRTHEIEGRFENIYLTETDVPAISAVKRCAMQFANTLCSRPIKKTGYWFNAMPPSSRTSRHDHNDGEELLSGVYYVQIPENSGKLLIYDKQNIKPHQPVEGEFVFFEPHVVHEVETNRSNKLRLSIAFNFLR